MNGLEAFRRIKDEIYWEDSPTTIFPEECLIVEKYLKVLEIIKEKKVDIYEDISESDNFNEYVDNFNYQQRCCGSWGGKTLLTKEDMETIYKRLGNGINRKLCVKFVESGLDMLILTKEELKK